MKIAFVSLGCAKNLVNTEQMMALVQAAGHTVTGEPEGADVAVLNTCGFIDSAKSEAIQNILVEAQARGISSLWCCDMLYAYDFAYSLIGGPGELMAAVILGYEDEPSPRKRHKTPDEVLERRTLRDES